LNANALACLVRLSVELVEDAANVVGIIDAAIAQSLGLKLDYACMLGSGVSPEPCGISETDGINNVEMGTGDGLALSSFDPFSQAVQLIREANGEPGALIWAPRTAGEVDRLKDTTNQPLKPPTSFEALRKYVSSQIPIDQTVGTSTDCSTVFLGDFAQLFVGMRKNLIIEAARMGDSDSVSKMQVIIRAYLRADARVVRPSHFTTITGIREG
jgi:HK97 family phage major capsid protein